MIETIAAKILEAAAKSAVSVLDRVVKRKNDELLKTRKKPVEANFVATMHLVEGAVARHTEEVRTWSSTLRFEDLKTQKSVLAIYVDLDTYLMPLSTHVSPIERKPTRPLLKALMSSQKSAAILGNPGAGKTTSLQKICADFFQKGKALANYNFPILIRLRELSTSTSSHPIYDKLQTILAVEVVFPGDKESREAKETREEEEREEEESRRTGKKDDKRRVKKRKRPGIPREVRAEITRQTLNKYLDGLQALILLDGFDEIAGEKLREAVIADIESLAGRLRDSRILVTSRSREFRYKLAGLEKFEIAPLTRPQIETFALRWLESRTAAEDFLSKVFASPFSDTAIRPLTLAHLCAIYERVKTIPEKPKSVYKRIVNLLLEEWDSQRQIARRSRYAGFDADRKFELLAHIAYLLTLDGTLNFDDKHLKRIYSSIHAEYGLPATEGNAVIGEIESHTGLILESGYKSYEFAHKSLQEFLCADYIVRLPNARKMQVDLLPNELAIATALSSKPAAYFAELVLRVFPTVNLDQSWYGIYLFRLSLEKVEFQAKYHSEATWAALILLTKIDEPSGYVELFESVFPSNLRAFLEDDYYVEHRRTNQHVYFRQIHRRGDLPLPEILRVPTSLLSKR